jgi:hypothetical protein
MRWRLASAMAIVVVAGCGGQSSIGPILASTPASIGTGSQRVLIGLVDVDTNEMVASPDLPVVATLRDRIGSPLGEYIGEFVWIVPDVRGLYAFDFELPGPGTYQVTIDTEGHNDLGPIGVVASEDPPGPGVGDLAPLSATRTLDDTALEDLTSDPNPDPSFYEQTVAEAVTSGPTVIVFGTPAWCESQACGPMLDQVKGLSDEYADLNYVHVEIYEDIHVDAASELVPVPAVAEWELVSEPWVFVTDATGKVSARFEGAVSDDELRSAFADVSP